MHLRDATAEDAELLTQLLVLAFNWTGEQRLTRQQLLADPRAGHYVTAWPRSSDFGVVATAGDGSSLGAVWARLLPPEDPGYGFVALDVPELSMAVHPDGRGRGVGTALLSAIVARALELGWTALSLSVEDGNDVARRLYQRHGFSVVGREGSSDTMLLELRSASAAEPGGAAARPPLR